MNTRTVTHLLDPDWTVVIGEELIANPAGIAFNVEPDALGQYDAELGLPCDPTGRGYRKLGDVETYCIAYNDTTALWAKMVAAKNDEVADTFDYEGALLELVDGCEDQEFWRKGQF